MADDIELPDGTVIKDRRKPPRGNVMQRIAAEPLASIAIGLTLATLAWGTITSNTRNAKEAEKAKIQAQIAANNSKAAEINSEAARALADTIHEAQESLARIGEASRRATFDTHNAIYQTMICGFRVLFTLPERRDQAQFDTCIKPLTQPPTDPKVNGNDDHPSN